MNWGGCRGNSGGEGVGDNAGGGRLFKLGLILKLADKYTNIFLLALAFDSEAVNGMKLSDSRRSLM